MKHQPDEAVAGTSNPSGWTPARHLPLLGVENKGPVRKGRALSVCTAHAGKP